MARKRGRDRTRGKKAELRGIWIERGRNLTKGSFVK
jgi:hypothetical protein